MRSYRLLFIIIISLLDFMSYFINCLYCIDYFHHFSVIVIVVNLPCCIVVIVINVQPRTSLKTTF